MKNKLLLTILCAGGAMTATALDADIVATQAYRWHGDTITQGQYKAYAPRALNKDTITPAECFCNEDKVDLMM